MRVSRILQFALGIALAAGGLAIFFHNVDIHKLRGELLSCNPVTVVVCVACTVLTILLRALRWSIMLPDAEKTHKRNLFPIVAIAFMLNNILPARLGEAARVVLLWKKNGYRPMQSIGSIVLERIFDTCAFMTCFFIPVFFLDTMKAERVVGASPAGKNLTLEAFAVLFCGIVVSVCGILFLYSRFPQWMGRMADMALRIFPQSLRGKLRGIGIDVFSNLNWIFSLKKVLVVIAYTTLMMLCYGFMVALITDQPQFTLLHGLFANSFAAMGAAIPLAPGFVGTLHAVLLQGLLFCGLPREKAIAVTLLYHAIPFCTVTLLGLFYFFRMHVTFREISSSVLIEKNNRTPYEPINK